jgi:hypothetical protein
MLQRRLGQVFAVGLALAAAPATAQVIPDNFVGGRTSDLAALCAAGPNDPVVRDAVNYCHGFLMAVGQFHAEVTREGARIRPFFCLPNPRPSVSDITGGFVAWARANPQFAGTSAVEGVVRYGTATFPCPTPPARGRRS